MTSTRADFLAAARGAADLRPDGLPRPRGQPAPVPGVHGVWELIDI